MFDLDTPITADQLDFSVRSDLFELPGRDEDGQLAVGECHYVVAQAASGQRWQHAHVFPSHGMVDYEEGRFPGIIDRKAAQRAQSLCDRISASRAPLDPEQWTEIDPCYGSEHYQRLDAGKFFRNREISEAFVAGEINERDAIDRMMK